MSDPAVPPVVPAAVPAPTVSLADGEWHRLHPATPLLRGGLYLVAIIGIIVANLRERLVEWFLPELAARPATSAATTTRSGSCSTAATC